jgi:hypothetical protein
VQGWREGMEVKEGDEGGENKKRAEDEVQEMIGWQDEPPPMIKCVTRYDHPSWVRVFEGLENRTLDIGA